MRASTALVFLLAAPSFAIRTPSADEVASLNSNTANAYAQQNDLATFETKLQEQVGSNAVGWEDLLSKKNGKALSAARLRAGSAWSTLMEETMVTYGLLPLTPSPTGGPGIPMYPDAVMQGGDFKGTNRPWRIVFKEPEEGSVLGENGKPLYGPAFEEFLETHSGMTSPDGTTIIWGKKFDGKPFKLAQTIYHELVHYELFADRKWVEAKTGPEREIEAHARSRAALAQFGLDPKTLKDEQNLEDGNIAYYSAKNSTQRGARERRTRLD